jgi:putative ABC transport system permease protein
VNSISIQLLKLAFRSLKLNWRQSLTALISISAGFAALTLFQGYMDDVQKMYENTNIERAMYGHFLIEKKDQLPFTEAEHTELKTYLESLDSVLAAMRLVNISGQITNGRASFIFLGQGVDIEAGEKIRGESWRWNAMAGEPLSTQNKNESLLIGKALSKIMGCDVNPPKGFLSGLGGFKPEVRPMNCPFQTLQLSLMTGKGQMNGLDLTLVGVGDMVYKEVDERFVDLSLETAQSLMNNNDVHRIHVRLKNEQQLSSMLATVNAWLANKQGSAKAMSWKDHALGDLYRRTMGLLTVFRNFVVSVILLISALSVFNTFMRNISERSREIGTLRSFGFQTSQIRLLFVAEAFFMSVFGVLIGFVISYITTKSIDAAGLTYKPGVVASPIPFHILLSPGLLLWTGLFLCALVVVTSLIALKNPLNKKIVDCLNHV